MRVMCVAGARPNFMKVSSVLDAMRDRGADCSLVHTGQHFDPEMSAVFFEDLSIMEPTHHLGVGPGTYAGQIARVMLAFEPVLMAEQPDVVVVVGDVNSTIACALVAANTDVPLAHVEAGLRSRDWSMPEEINRVVTDRVSDILFAPSDDAVENLKAEGLEEDRIFLVGNIMIDVLLQGLARVDTAAVMDRFGVESRGYGLVTLHRPSNVDHIDKLGDLVGTLTEVAADIPLIFPAHPRTAAHLSQLKVPPSIRVIAPLRYLDFIALEAEARLVLTDSGGIQEETSVLGIPCLTLRTSTERPITVTLGTNRVVGVDAREVVAAAREALRVTIEPRRIPLWDGQTGERIADVLMDLPSKARAHQD